jgi:hypothetical protein
LPLWRCLASRHPESRLAGARELFLIRALAGYSGYEAGRHGP